jgi:hypothetical protein
MTRHHTLGFAAAAAFMMIQPANAIDTMESIGAEKCDRAAKAYEIDFLTPDNATGEGRGQRRDGRASRGGNSVTRWQGLHE